MKRTVSAMTLIITSLTIAGCSTGATVTTKPDASTGAHSSASTAATLGQAITIKNGSDQLTVTAVKIVPNAQGANSAMTPDAGKQFVAIQFQMVNSGSTTLTGDPLSDVSASDAAGQQFSVDFDDTTAGQSLPSQINLTPGGKVLGFATFQVPTGDAITQVQFASESGMGNVAQWKVS